MPRFGFNIYIYSFHEKFGARGQDEGLTWTPKQHES